MTSPAVSPILDVQNVSVAFRGPQGHFLAVEEIQFQLAPQEFVCIVGPSGSGKSTLLRVVAGLLAPTRGRVVFGSGVRKPRIGLVFQQINLMPWRTVWQNITLPLEILGEPAEKMEQKTRDMIARVGLEGFEDAWPADLSGGMAQRVAIARAMIQDPDLLLLDEPFGSLDALTRDRMGSELLRIWQASRKAVIMVTHSISEAVFLADRVLVVTPRPARIALNRPIPFERPRTEDFRYTPEFSWEVKAIRQAIE